MSHFKLMNPVEHTIIIEKSKFITHLVPIEDELKAKTTLSQLRLLHPKANHHCYAYILSHGESHLIMNQSDDGEPTKTAGLPMLEQLKHANLIDTLAIVIRYFGGTLLGTGGLVRAYAGAVRSAIAEATLYSTTLMPGFQLTTDYTQARQIEYLLTQHQAVVQAIDYKEKVVFHFFTDHPSLIERLTQLNSQDFLLINQPKQWV